MKRHAKASSAGSVAAQKGNRGLIRWSPAVFLVALASILVASPGSALAACPNEEFRTGFSARLSDCRAYERVSPAERNGYEVLPAEVRATSPSGDKVAYKLRGGTAPGSGEGGIDDTLIGTRGASGWTYQSVNSKMPYDFQFNGSPLQWGVSADLSKAVVSTYAKLTPDTPPPGFLSPNYFVGDTTSESFQLLNPHNGVGGFNFGYAGGTPDLSHVVYNSRVAQTADPVTAETSNPYEWIDGEGARLVGVLPDGSIPPNGAAIGAGQEESGRVQHAISTDGRRVVFHSTPPGGNEHDVAGQIYSRIDGTSTRYISKSQRTVPDPEGTLPAYYLDAERQHGSKVLFLSCEKLTDDATAKAGSSGCTFESPLLLSQAERGSPDLYLYDLEANGGAGQLTDLTATNPAGGGVFGFIGASADLSQIYFVARNALAPGATEDSHNLYLWNQGTIHYIGELGEDDTKTFEHGANFRDSWNWGSGGGSPYQEKAARVSENGRYLLFTSIASLTGYDNSRPTPTTCASEHGCSEVYRYDSVSDQIECLSCPASGAPSRGDATLTARNNGSNTSAGLWNDAAELPLNLLEDGTAFFETPTGLLTADSNGKSDVYEFRDGEVKLISDGARNSVADFADASPSGNDVFFTTAAQLLGEDRDTQIDMYDARVNGGFYRPPPPPGCEGDACQSPASPPIDPTPGSSSFNGAGNQVARAKSKKRHHKKRHRAAKKRSHGKTTAHRKHG